MSTCQVPEENQRATSGVTWAFSKIGVPYFGILIIGILLFKVLF